nr:DUF3048 domain-containing protein [Arsenicicoccus piscis]
MAPVPVNPLTGQGPVPSGPVVAVKIDDTASSRPSRGVDRADVIYVEEVEGGLTRMIGVFTTYPTVRSVRSMRPMDAELLWNYGNLVYVATGGGGSGPATLAGSPFSRVIMDDGAAGFARDRSHPAPYNVNADLQLIASRTKGARAHNVGFTWAASDPRVAKAPADAAVSTRVGNTPMTFTWDAGAKTYVRTINGRRLNTAEGRPIAQPNVLVQMCDGYTDRSDIDPIGNPSRYTKTVGSGPFVLYRDGKRLTGTWKRPTPGAPTSYVDASGKPLPLAPGGAFVLLARKGTPAS